jgi:hypothetical protein
MTKFGAPPGSFGIIWWKSISLAVQHLQMQHDIVIKRARPGSCVQNTILPTVPCLKNGEIQNLASTFVEEERGQG